MKSSIQSKLFDNLITSDFLICKKKNSLKKDQFFNLDPIILLKSLKQFIRLIQFLKKDDNLNINFKNRQLNLIIKKFFEKNNLKLNLKINDLLSNNSSLNNNNKLLILLDNIAYKEKILFNKLIKSNYLLIQQINNNNTYNTLNTYNIQNDLINIKKLLFILCLINEISK